MHPYKNINILLATKHKKEQAIRAPFATHLQANIYVPDNYDTDEFGTFSGEIARAESPYATVIKKAKRAALQYGYHYAIASEGCFGPHPQLFFTAADEELMCFIDLKNDLVIVESLISHATNYAQLDITSQDDYLAFLLNVKFPSHALIIRSLTDNSIIAKGINSLTELNYLIDKSWQHHNKLRLETDMRALFNPTRLEVINKLAQQLVKRLLQLCKQCQTPGFGKVSCLGHLSCKNCGSDTSLYLFKVISCPKCHYQENLPREDGLTRADPIHCNYCNP